MLDPRLYRAAFAPFALALVIAAFSLVTRPRPIGTTLAPDAFDGAHAFSTLRELAGAFPDRRPGGPGDERLAELVRSRLRASFCGGGSACTALRVRRFGARTIDGRRTLTTVSATRLGQPGPGIVVVAHRDAAGPTAEAELSGTAALLELARLFDGRQSKRTLTLVSTSGGSGGAGGVRDLVGALPAEDPNPDAVLVLGDLASARVRKPWVLPWSTGGRLAPVRLRRTVEAAVRAETGQDAGSPRATQQLARLALPFALGEEGPLNAAGVPAVLLQVSGERPPSDGAPVSAAHLQAFGRAALRSIDALDNGPDLAAAPSEAVVVRNRLLPPWAIRLLAGTLLLPGLLAAVDGVARVRRRREPLGDALRWLAPLLVPLALAAGVLRLLGLAGVLGPALPQAVPAGRVPVGAAALGTGVVLLALAVLAVGPMRRWLGAGEAPAPGPGAAALALVLAVAAAVSWLVDPVASLLLVVPLHLWLLATVPELAIGRAAGAALVLAGLVPLALVLAVLARGLGAGPVSLAWSLELLVAGGGIGAGAVAAASILAGGCAGSLRMVLARARAREAEGSAAARVSGPSLGPLAGSILQAPGRERVRR